MSNNGFWILMTRTVTLFFKIKERGVVGKVLLVVVLAVVLMAGSVTPELAAQSPENGPEPNNPRPEPQQEVVEIETQDIGPQEVVGQSTTLYKRYEASTFVPVGSDATYAYHGRGCVYRTGGEDRYSHDLQLPEGAEIDYLRLYFYDIDPVNDAQAWLYAYDGYGNYTEVVSVSSSGTPGQSTAGSGFFSHTVDNVDEALAIMLSYSTATNDDLRICGVRIRYQYSFSTLYLPVVLKELTNP